MIANAETPEKSYRIIDLRGASSDGWNDSPSRGPAGMRVTPETAMQCDAGGQGAFPIFARNRQQAGAYLAAAVGLSEQRPDVALLPRLQQKRLATQLALSVGQVLFKEPHGNARRTHAAGFLNRT